MEDRLRLLAPNNHSIRIGKGHHCIPMGKGNTERSLVPGQTSVNQQAKIRLQRLRNPIRLKQDMCARPQL